MKHGFPTNEKVKASSKLRNRGRAPVRLVLTVLAEVGDECHDDENTGHCLGKTINDLASEQTKRQRDKTQQRKKKVAFHCFFIQFEIEPISLMEVHWLSNDKSQEFGAAKPDQWRKCRIAVKTIAMFRSLAAAITSPSRTEPPG